jgi:hypothetical protein
MDVYLLAQMGRAHGAPIHPPRDKIGAGRPSKSAFAIKTPMLRRVATRVQPAQYN